MHKNVWIILAVFATSFPDISHAKDEKLHLSVATEAHPHVRALQEGRVKAKCCDFIFTTHPAVSGDEEVRSAKHFDIVEVDLVPYLQKYSAGGTTDYVLIPVFLSRSFQLRNIYIRTDRGIQAPADLRGKTVGLSERAISASVWVRGIFHSSWSIKPGDILVKELPKARSALQTGDVDAAFSLAPLSGLDDKNAHVGRLFKNFYEVESEIFKVTRIFPILTALAVRKSLVKENPWLPEAIFLAFSEAKKKAMEDLTLPLPWAGPQLAETEKLMGKNFWSYGVKSNPKTLGALFRYLDEQGTLQKPVKVEDVFASSTLMLLED